MKKCSWFLLVLVVLLTNQVCGQKVFIKELAEAKKMPASARKDSIIVSILFQLSHISSKNIEKWSDTLTSFSVENQNELGIFSTKFFKSDSLINQNELLSIASQLEKLNAYSYASLFYSRVGAAYTYYYINRKEQNLALNYYNKALQLSLKSKSKQDIIRVYDFIGEHYFLANDYQKSIENLTVAEKIMQDFKIKSLLPTVYAYLASNYIYLNKIELAEKYYNLASKKLEDIDYDFDPSYKVYIKNVYFSNASKYFYEKKQYKNALLLCLKGMRIIELFKKESKLKSKFQNYETDFLQTMHNSYFELKDYKNAYESICKLQIIKKIKGVDKVLFEFKDLNQKYQTELNKLKIVALENEKLRTQNQNQRLFRWFFFVLSVIGLLTTFYVFRTNKKLKKNNQELLDKNKEISEAMLKGQTIERQRVALDLHDNLGSTLSALWLSIDTIDKSKMNVEEKEIHQNLRDNLEKAYNDVRLLSHNLLPEEFEKQGLTIILQGFVRKMNKNSTIKFDLKIDENFGRVDNKIEFELYSICLELVNNIIKHSKATEAKISLSRNEKQIELVVSDNGIGTFKNDSDGKGMKNVKARVESLNGTWKMQPIDNHGVIHEVLIPV